MAKIHLSILIILFSLVISACTSKISQENFNKIKVGMSVEEVDSILGEPTQVTTMTFGDVTGTHAIWENRNGKISVQYFNRVVKLKNYTKGVTRPRG